MPPTEVELAQRMDKKILKVMTVSSRGQPEGTKSEAHQVAIVRCKGYGEAEVRYQLPSMRL